MGSGSCGTGGQNICLIYHINLHLFPPVVYTDNNMLIEYVVDLRHFVPGALSPAFYTILSPTIIRPRTYFKRQGSVPFIPIPLLLHTATTKLNLRDDMARKLCQAKMRGTNVFLLFC